MNGSEIANKSVHIVSDENILVQVFIHTKDHIEGYLAIPVDRLGYRYQISTFCAVGGYCQIAVAATHANTTQVYLQFPLSVPEIVFCVGKLFFRSKRDRYVTLEKYDVLQIETATDITGTYIVADRPIAVIAATRNLTIAGLQTHLVEQLQPIEKWGKEFHFGTLGTNMYGDVIKISAVYPGTVVEMRGYPPFVISNINHTVTRRLDQDTVTYIKSNKPIQIVQFTGKYTGKNKFSHPPPPRKFPIN